MIRAITAIILGLAITPASSHDSWINHGGYTNAKGELCCGENDCVQYHVYSPVSLPTVGWRLPSGEFLPQSGALKSEDSSIWVCRRPDGTPRCVFGPDNRM